jgi:hypothetical protein
MCIGMATMEMNGAEQVSHAAFEGRLLHGPLLVCFSIKTK